VLNFAHEPFHPRSEQVRLLRTELLLRHSVWGEANAVALVSARPGEGRSHLAAELALAFAQLDRPTLLVDADFRRPRQHVLFGADLEKGLAPALAVGGASPQMHGVEGFPHLSVVTAGISPPNPLELLTDRRFEALMDEWRRRFDFIVVDTPPITDFADGLAVATIVGRVLTVNRARHTRYDKAREMLRRLAASNAIVLGGVLNHF
jgi:receptor protein-tyrosine kinase